MHQSALNFIFAIPIVIFTTLIFSDPQVYSKELEKNLVENDCGYPMCQYEKENIDMIIIEHARTSQTLMFGEIHDTVVEGDPSPVEDSLYVISLLKRLKEIGYKYLALEVNKNASGKGHSSDILRFYETYKRGFKTDETQYSYAKPGWIKLVRTAIDTGYKIRFIDAVPNNESKNLSRDRVMFERIKTEIFDKDPKAKVIVYVGANHVSENETYPSMSMCDEVKPLGNLLSAYTKGKNFSVYMGYTYDSPVGCDLFISYFIWDSYNKQDWPAATEAFTH